jgi:hypothetical protein
MTFEAVFPFIKKEQDEERARKLKFLKDLLKVMER